jgi:hypothetical protein
MPSRCGNQAPPVVRPSVIPRPLPGFPRPYPAVPPSPQERGCLSAFANRSYAYNLARFSRSGKRWSHGGVRPNLRTVLSIPFFRTTNFGSASVAWPRFAKPMRLILAVRRETWRRAREIVLVRRRLCPSSHGRCQDILCSGLRRRFSSSLRSSVAIR